jgi:hypothetical protein
MAALNRHLETQEIRTTYYHYTIIKQIIIIIIIINIIIIIIIIMKIMNHGFLSLVGHPTGETQREIWLRWNVEVGSTRA